MHHERVKFATQIDSVLLKDLKDLAKTEGRQLQALVDEAIADLVEKHRKSKPRRQVMAAYETSLDRYGELYRKLAE